MIGVIPNSQRGDVNTAGTSNGAHNSQGTQLIQPQQPDTEATSRRDQAEPFTLPRDQRQRVKQGKVFTGSQRQPISGTSTKKMSVQGLKNATEPCSIYIGRLSNKVTATSLRKHLCEHGINNISDIIDLKCKVHGQSSFCVVADGKDIEDAIYNPAVWPQGVKVRPFGEKTPSSKNAHQAPRSQNRQNHHKNTSQEVRYVERNTQIQPQNQSRQFPITPSYVNMTPSPLPYTYAYALQSSPAPMTNGQPRYSPYHQTAMPFFSPHTSQPVVNHNTNHMIGLTPVIMAQ